MRFGEGIVYEMEFRESIFDEELRGMCSRGESSSKANKNSARGKSAVPNPLFVLNHRQPLLYKHPSARLTGILEVGEIGLGSIKGEVLGMLRFSGNWGNLFR